MYVPFGTRKRCPTLENGKPLTVEAIKSVIRNRTRLPAAKRYNIICTDSGQINLHRQFAGPANLPPSLNSYEFKRAFDAPLSRPGLPRASGACYVSEPYSLERSEAERTVPHDAPLSHPGKRSCRLNLAAVPLRNPLCRGMGLRRIGGRQNDTSPTVQRFLPNL